MAQLALSYRTRLSTARARLLELLSDLGWHEHGELADVAGVRYGARLGELRDDGYVVETDELELGRRYRLTSTTPGARREPRVKCFLTVPDAESVVGGYPTRRAIAAVKEALSSGRANRRRL